VVGDIFNLRLSSGFFEGLTKIPTIIDPVASEPKLEVTPPGLKFTIAFPPRHLSKLFPIVFPAHEATPLLA
jgi:hypothetical protein